mgnify:CR=1 FL=1
MAYSQDTLHSPSFMPHVIVRGWLFGVRKRRGILQITFRSCVFKYGNHTPRLRCGVIKPDVQPI